MTAEEARERTLSAILSKTKYAEIMYNIRSAADRGQNYDYVYSPIEKVVKEVLISQGFSIRKVENNILGNPVEIIEWKIISKTE